MPPLVYAFGDVPPPAPGFRFELTAEDFALDVYVSQLIEGRATWQETLVHLVRYSCRPPAPGVVGLYVGWCEEDGQPRPEPKALSGSTTKLGRVGWTWVGGSNIRSRLINCTPRWVHLRTTEGLISLAPAESPLLLTWAWVAVTRVRGDPDLMRVAGPPALLGRLPPPHLCAVVDWREAEGLDALGRVHPAPILVACVEALTLATREEVEAIQSVEDDPPPLPLVYAWLAAVPRKPQHLPGVHLAPNGGGTHVAP